MGLRFRSEATKSAVVSFPVGTTVLAAATLFTGIQRPGIYRAALSGNASTAATFQFQTTDGTAISAVYTIGVNGFEAFYTQFNGDPWWQGAAALGLQIVVTGATITGDVYWAAGA